MGDAPPTRCDGCGKSLNPLQAVMSQTRSGDNVCMNCVKARHRAAMDNTCKCGRQAVPEAPVTVGGYKVRVDGEVKNAGGRTFIPCKRCLGTIKQIS